MATVTKRGSSYVVRYTYRDDQGKSHDGWENCKREKEAKQRKQQIEYEIANDTFLNPNRMTVRELTEKWLDLQSAKHKWAPKL